MDRGKAKTTTTKRLRQLLGMIGCCVLAVGGAQSEEPSERSAGEQEPDGQRQSSCFSSEIADSSLAEDYRQYEGATIASIRFQPVQVFDPRDPKENNRVYQFFNTLHVHTRPSVIRAQLLFDENGPLNPGALAESERLLRSLPYLGDASIQVDEVCGDHVALLVVTRDLWTTEPEVSLGREGGETKRGFGLSEGNVLGTGNAFSVGYQKDLDRSSVSYGFYSPHLMDSRVSVRLAFADNSDGQNSLFELQRPFYSLKAPWAAGVRSQDLTAVESIRLGDEEVNAYRHASEYHEVFAGAAVSVNARRTQRVSIGLAQSRHMYSETSLTETLPENFNIRYPWVEYRYLENKFAVYKNLNQLHRVEDVSMGADLRIRLGHAGRYLGNESEVTRYEVDYFDLLGVGQYHLVQFHLMLDGRHHSGSSGLNEVIWGGDVGYHFLEGEKHRWYGGLQYHQGRNLQPHSELTAGGGLGLRGYPLDFQRGNKRYLLTLEKRYISDWHPFSLLRLASVVYVDAGRAWGEATAFDGHLLNVGTGLRLSSSKAQPGKLIHFDLAYPLAHKNQVAGFQWVIKASQGF